LATAPILSSWNFSSNEFQQQALPYAYNALEPFIDALTMEIHYTKHAATYAKNVADACTAEKVNTDTTSLRKLLANISIYSAKMRNNAGGHFNHSYFWITMSQETNQKPSGKLAKDIEKQFGSFDKFKQEFIDAGVKHFGSGWVWLCVNDGKFKVQGFLNQSNPYIEKCGHPLLGCDIWEHAYYLKYQNNREKYITNWFKVINWDFISKRYEGLK
jgi:Fe-Mn family superoxide dismutase